MMRFQSAICSGLAVLLTVPGTLIRDDGLHALEGALSDTLRALQVLSGLQEEEAPPLTTEMVHSLTEAPVLDQRRRDDRLTALRNEVNLLQMELDTLDVAPPASQSEAATKQLSAPPGAAALTPEVTTGLDDRLRNALRSLGTTRSGEQVETGPRVASTQGASTTISTDLPERDGYSASPILEARACYFAGKFERGLALVERMNDVPSALYWKGRLLERLERYEEAIAAHQRVIELAADSFEGKKSRADLEFLLWKKGFIERISSDGTKSSGGKR